jgi:hypothetical protein
VGGETLAQVVPQPVGDAIPVLDREIEAGDLLVPSHQHRLLAAKELGHLKADFREREG